MSLIHGGKAREGGPEKAVAGFDEDAITLAVAAAVECLVGLDRTTVDGVYFATTTSPFREKQAAAFVAKALDLRSTVATIDFTGSLRAAAGALLTATHTVQSHPEKLILVVAADSRLAAPRSPIEMNMGDAAAAFLVGSRSVLATITEAFTHTDEIYDVWRTEQDDYLRAWEDRAAEAFGKIEELEPELERRQYELEIAQRLLAKAQDDAARETWQTQVDVLAMLVQETEHDLAEQEAEQALCDTVIAEIEADLAVDEPATNGEQTGNDIF